MRLLAHAEAKRILFLVDRKNLGTQTKNEFQRFQPHGTGKLFTELYNVQLLSGRHVEDSSAVVISTIQRLYAALRGEEIDEEVDEMSGFELAAGDAERPVAYNPAIPIETFDVIIVDECHRSIYGVWRQVLEYFDAFVIGLTATPSKHTLGYFNQNLVAEYPYERSVADGVNVGYEIFRIRTRIGEHGDTIEAGYSVPTRDRKTRRLRYQELEDDRPYTKQELDRSVLAPNQIRTVLTAYRDALPVQLFPGRTEVPKTLIFAKDDHHAEEIVTIAREVFGKGNEFAKKITYRVSGATPAELIKEFQTSYHPRLAVTVDMIATGTDIKPVEVVMFLRDVKSELYYEQMKGRGVRTISATDLRQVTPDARTKDKFVLIDAVGVTETAKTASQPLERKRLVSFDRLVDRLAAGERSDDALSSLAGRLSALAGKLSPEDDKRVRDPSPERLLTDVVSLARYALGQSDALEPFAVDVERRFNLWLGREKNAGRGYTDEQMRWLRLIRDHVAANAEATVEDLQDVPAFADRGGRIAAGRAFGAQRVAGLLDELSDALVA